MAGNYRFSGSSAAAVVNRGTITASDGGYVALLGRTVSNEGAITATLGSIALASGDQITLNFGGNSLVDVTIDKGTYKALVENKGLIKADGGRVVMTARAADAVLSAQVNNSGDRAGAHARRSHRRRRRAGNGADRQDQAARLGRNDQGRRARSTLRRPRAARAA